VYQLKHTNTKASIVTLAFNPESHRPKKLWNKPYSSHQQPKLAFKTWQFSRSLTILRFGQQIEVTSKSTKCM